MKISEVTKQTNEDWKQSLKNNFLNLGNAALASMGFEEAQMKLFVNTYQTELQSRFTASMKSAGVQENQIKAEDLAQFLLDAGISPQILTKAFQTAKVEVDIDLKRWNPGDVDDRKEIVVNKDMAKRKQQAAIYGWPTPGENGDVDLQKFVPGQPVQNPNFNKPIPDALVGQFRPGNQGGTQFGSGGKGVGGATILTAKGRNEVVKAALQAQMRQPSALQNLVLPQTATEPKVLAKEIFADAGESARDAGAGDGTNPRDRDNNGRDDETGEPIDDGPGQVDDPQLNDIVDRIFNLSADQRAQLTSAIKARNDARAGAA